MSIAKRVALVTGSGQGIGRAIALKLSGSGALVVVNDISDVAEKVVGEIRSLGGESQAILADVSSSSEVTKLIEQVIARFGRIDILVNNAGIARDQLVLRMSDEDWDKVINIDLKSVFLCTRAALKFMVRERWGRIVNISSIVGIAVNRGQANYASAKAGVIGFTRTVAREVASRGITANAIAPGFIDTEMTKGINDKWREELKNRIPVGYLGHLVLRLIPNKMIDKV